MITIIGTGHIFNIAEPVTFIIKHSWPDAVLVELDESRFKAMTDPDAKTTEAPKAYKKAAEYQKKMAAENNTTTGSELIAAATVGRAMGADVFMIDVNAAEALQRMHDEMPFREKMRFKFSGIKDNLFSRKETVEQTLEDFAADEERHINELRERFPTMIRIIVDERNEHMAKKINEAIGKYENIVIVVGDGHVEALVKLMNAEAVKKIRLRELMNKERMDAIRAELWNHTEEKE